jgi:membrane-associated phospholipid phosphatase
VSLAALIPVDEQVQDFVFRHVVSHEVRLLSNGLTALGTTEAAVGILGTFVVVGYRTADATLWRASVGGLAGLALGGLTTHGVKLTTCRARPRLIEGWGIGPPAPPEDPTRRGFFHWPCFLATPYHSFPSGHATTALVIATALVQVLPARRRLWLLIAGGVGASRVFLNAHFLADVVAGSLVGWWAGRAGQWVALRYGCGARLGWRAGEDSGAVGLAHPAEPERGEPGPPEPERVTPTPGARR